MYRHSHKIDGTKMFLSLEIETDLLSFCKGDVRRTIKLANFVCQ